jgi:hypothetical protein
MLVYVFFLFEYSERNEWMNKYLIATANGGSAGVTYCQSMNSSESVITNLWVADATGSQDSSEGAVGLF